MFWFKYIDMQNLEIKKMIDEKKDAFGFIICCKSNT